MPRILSMIFILFLAMFSLDVFEGNYGFWGTALALFMHNIPSLALLVVLLISWKYEIFGGIVFILAGIAYIFMTASRVSEWYIVLSWSMIIAGPAFLIGILFLINWFGRKKRASLWGIIKGTFSGIGKGIGAGTRFIGKKIHENKERKDITGNPAYKTTAEFDEFVVKNNVTGNYSSFEERFYKDSLIALIFGKRGSGKTALGFRILENAYYKTKRKCYVLGVPQAVLPSWIDSIDDVEKVPSGGIVLVDEGALTYSSRESMSKGNKEISRIMAIARHNDLTLFFITQNTGLIDRNILKLSDALIVKEGSLLQLEMEREEIKKFYAKSKKYFDKLSDNKKKYAYIIDSDFEGLVEHKLPSFWSTKISKSRAGKTT